MNKLIFNQDLKNSETMIRLITIIDEFLMISKQDYMRQIFDNE
jgi:hypothetical protein